MKKKSTPQRRKKKSEIPAKERSDKNKDKDIEKIMENIRMFQDLVNGEECVTGSGRCCETCEEECDDEEDIASR